MKLGFSNVEKWVEGAQGWGVDGDVWHEKETEENCVMSSIR